jgi:hypothetical protein
MERNSGRIAVVACLLFATLPGWPAARAGEPERVQGRGFSYVPPSGPGWQLISRSPTETMYGKQPSGEKVGGHFTHSFLMAVKLYEPMSAANSKAFVNAVRDAHLADGTESRFMTVRASAQHYGEPGVFCAEYEALVHERDNPHYRGMLLVMEQHGIACLDRSSTFVVTICTSERRPAGEPSFLDRTTRDEAAAFLRSLVVDAYRDSPPAAVAPVPRTQQSAGAARERWTSIGYTDGVPAFVDLSSIVVAGTGRLATIKMDFPPHSTRSPAFLGPEHAEKWLDFVVFQGGFNCSKGLSRQEAATGYFEDGSSARDTSRPFPQPWGVPQPGSWLDNALRLVCQQDLEQSD